MVAHAPAIDLYDFQKNWLSDNGRFRIGCVSRQCGKSFMVSLDTCLRAIQHGDLTVMLSAGERQSKELMEKCRTHLTAMAAAASDIDEQTPFFGDTRYTQLTITLNNGGRIVGLPANPDTARGFTGNCVLDEFAFHKDSEKIWRALFPTISRGYRLSIVSTPQGFGNRFHQIFTGDNNFSRHFIDIYQAVKDGVPHNINELKDAIDDDDAWQQEYLCLFIDDASSWLDYDIIANCSTDAVQPEVDQHSFNLDKLTVFASSTNRRFAGVDIGRKHDHTVIWINDLVGDIYWTRLILLIKKEKFRNQRDLLWQIMAKLNISRVCIDATGIGAQLAEDTVDRFGGYTAEAVEFTNSVKQDLAVRLKRRFEDRRVRIPVSRKLRDDLHSVKKTVTSAGNVRFDAERTKDGHADRFWAAALAHMASDEGAVKPECTIL